MRFRRIRIKADESGIRKRFMKHSLIFRKFQYCEILEKRDRDLLEDGDEGGEPSSAPTAQQLPGEDLQVSQSRSPHRGTPGGSTPDYPEPETVPSLWSRDLEKIQPLNWLQRLFSALQETKGSSEVHIRIRFSER